MLSAQGDAVQQPAVHWRRHGVHEVATVHKTEIHKQAGGIRFEALRLVLGLLHKT